jgi:antitoxin (DNA-binding transcriptional repressor) of toxin-antitoxin stability system
VCHMTTISIRQLHDKTGEWVRKASKLGEIHVSERGKTIAKIIPQAPAHEVPYFARRKLTRRFRAIMEKLEGGTDSTQIVSEGRDRRLE